MDVTKDGAVDAPTTVGGQLRAAREQQGQTLDDIGRQTRVPVRHLVQIEEGRLQGLPAAPYSAGFVKSYARAVGLDPVALSHAFRAEFEVANRDAHRISYEPYEPADPIRLPPRLLAFVAVTIAILLVLGYSIWRSGVLSGEGPDARAKLAAQGDDGNSTATGAPLAATPAAATAPVGGAVVLTAVQPAWFKVAERSGPVLFQGTLDQGKSFTVPATAVDPVIRTGRPEALAVTVGDKPVAALGEPAHTVTDLSLKPDSLLARQGAPVPLPAAAPPALVNAPAPSSTADVPPAFQSGPAPQPSND